MATVSYPGVYIEEFTPGPPIEGVGTSTAAFIGTAEKGPADLRRLHSWDEYMREFGEFVVGAPPSYLAPAVYGFFLNGGTDCFVLRATTAKHSTVDLLSRRTGSTEPVLVAEAIEEGIQGDSIDITVDNASILADGLKALSSTASTLEVHVAESTLAQPIATGPGADRTRAQVADNSDFIVGETVVVTAPGTADQEAVIKDTSGTQMLVFEVPLGGSGDFDPGGSVRSTNLKPGQKEVRVVLPTGLQLQAALPRGATILIDDGNASPDVRTVEMTTAAGAEGRIGLTEGLKREYDLSAGAPTVASLEFDLTLTGPLKPTRSRSRPSSGSRCTLTIPTTGAPGSTRGGRASASRQAPPAQPASDPRPKRETQLTLGGGADDNRANAWANLLGNAGDALAKLDAEEEIDIVVIPGALADAAQRALVDYCERSRRFAILDSIPAKDNPGQDPNKLVEAQRDKVSSEGGYAALYYPWIQAMNPRTQRVELWPPSGHVAGLYARSDARAGVHKAPANAILRGTLGMEVRLSNDAQGPLNMNGINVLRVFPVGRRRWSGARGRRSPVTSTGSTSTSAAFPVPRKVDRAEHQVGGLRAEQPRALAAAEAHDQRLPDDAPGRTERSSARLPKEAFYVRIDEALEPRVGAGARPAAHRDRRRACVSGGVHRRPHRHLAGRLRDVRGVGKESRHGDRRTARSVHQLQLPRRDRRHHPRRLPRVQRLQLDDRSDRAPRGRRDTAAEAPGHDEVREHHAQAGRHRRPRALRVAPVGA